MRLFALVPVKPPHLGKSRLAGTLTGAERRALNVELAARAIEACLALCGGGRTLVVTPCEDIVRLAAGKGAVALREAAPGLNAALAQAAARAQASGAEGVMVVPTDLPGLSAARLAAVAAALPAAPGCVVVPDRHGRGTNLLALAPARADFFRFGVGSFARHVGAARALGYRVRIHRCAELQLDLDLPEDLEAWTASAR